MRQVNNDSSVMLKLAKKHCSSIAWGIDLFGSPAKQTLQSMEFSARGKYFSPLEILRQATSYNAELFKLSSLRHPYQEGALGVVEEGAYADLLLVDGNPLQDMEVMMIPCKNFRIITKDGIIYKNTLVN